MTKKQIAKYGWRWQGLLRLEEWDVRFDAVNAETLVEGELSDKVAEIETDKGAGTTTFHIANKRPEDEVAKSIRHEMLHLSTFEFTDFAESLIGRLGAEASALARDQLYDIEERLVLRLSRMVDELLLEQDDVGRA